MNNEPGKKVRFDEDATLNVEAAVEHIERQLSPDELRNILDLKQPDQFGDFSENSTIGVGGIGAVFAVHDSQFNRLVALKVLRPAYRNDSKYIDNFVREARITAQIDHPNVVPVHQLGVLKDAGAYFTMKLVEGENLRVILKKLESGEPEYLKKYTLNHLLDIFLAVCNGVSFAHSKGIIHRDLKPGNVMAGSYGEVLVMDWGLAKYRADQDSATTGQKIDLNSEIFQAVDNDVKTQFDTIAGTLHGTPAFMAPEQARGNSEEIDERTDIYGLGTILYSILTWKRSRFDPDLPVEEILRKVVAGDFPPPGKAVPRKRVPVELEAICLKAMAHDKGDRYLSVQGLIRDIHNYRENFPVSAYSNKVFYRGIKYCQRKPMLPFSILVGFFSIMMAAIIMAVAAVLRANPVIETIDEHIAVGDREMLEAQELANYRKQMIADGGELSYSEAQELRSRIDEATTEAEKRYLVARDLLTQLEGANISPERLNAALGGMFAKQLELALLLEDFDGVRDIYERINIRNSGLRAYMATMYPALMEQVSQIVRAEGYVEFAVEPADTEINLYRMDISGKYTDGVGGYELLGSVTGSMEMPLSEGGYLVRLNSPSGVEVFYPLLIKPGDYLEKTLKMPAEIPEGTVYVPGGEFRYGFDFAPGLYRKEDLPGFFIGRHEVTLGEYQKFFNDLRDEFERKKYMPLHIFSKEERNFEPIFQVDGSIRAPFTADMPVTGINYEAAEAYCRWYGEQHGVVCRLPSNLEWEKAARGIDGRNYVWGNSFKPENALYLENPKLKEYMNGAEVGLFPLDCSVYGAMDMAGNVREYVSSEDESFPRMVKGGSFDTTQFTLMCAAFGRSYENENDSGFRILIESDSN